MDHRKKPEPQRARSSPHGDHGRSHALYADLGDLHDRTVHGRPSTVDQVGRGDIDLGEVLIAK
jgi:hypothetical protein